jgi:hypothetical protein
MSKLTLDLERIQVESFSTHHAGGARGTVDARQGRETFTCPAPTQDPTCANSCGCTVDPGTDMFTCYGTCWDPTCDTCMITCNQATGPERCCA